MDQNRGSDEGTSTVALSVADRYGTTIAVQKLDSGDMQWRTIGSNLIAYWAGNGGSIHCYLDALTQQILDTQVVSLKDLMSLNEDSKDILPMDEWTGGSVTVYARDRLVPDTLFNLLKMEISRSSTTMDLVTKTSSAMGTAASAALEVLTNYHCIISCSAFDTDDNLREHIVYKAILGAVISDKSCNGYCEIIRGSSTQGWKSLSMIPMKKLVTVYSPRVRFMPEEESPPCTSRVVSYINNREAKPKTPTVCNNIEDALSVLRKPDTWTFYREVTNTYAKY